jgi:hypothetical protein
MNSHQTADLYFAAFLIATNAARFTGLVENGRATRSLFVFAEPIPAEARVAFFAGTGEVHALAYATWVKHLKALSMARREGALA